MLHSVFFSNNISIFFSYSFLQEIIILNSYAFYVAYHLYELVVVMRMRIHMYTLSCKYVHEIFLQRKRRKKNCSHVETASKVMIYSVLFFFFVFSLSSVLLALLVVDSNCKTEKICIDI